jgi:streptomycin 3"-adenylyltransferase|tara:strand:- start:237 stop:620 length:384 start_codon:yes stop_codon:yes gene_type:complete
VIPYEAQQAQSIAEDVLGESIVGIYLFGSAVADGLQRNSDVDVLVAVSDSPTCKQREALVAQLMKVSGTIGNAQATRPVELTVITISDVVPWRFPRGRNLYTVSGCGMSSRQGTSRNQPVILIWRLC